ncbi:hypothetical protein [Bradyrhizobium sp. S3.2.6]|uniref:hypothetical protein n=1 Tax=unclassified Bradyrhizobium TaxID=2631580 RepID=UPI00339A8B26
MILPVASERSGSERSGIDGRETDGIEGMAGIMSRADLVIPSIRLGVEVSSHCALQVAIANNTSINIARISIFLG